MATLYECMFIVRPTLDDEEVTQVAEHAKGVVTTGGGEVVSFELLGRRRLAYEIDGNTDGVYGLLYFHGSQEVIQDLRHELQLSSDVIRAMVVRANERAMALRATAPAEAEEEAAPTELEGVGVITAEPAPAEAEEPAPEPEAAPEPKAEDDTPEEPESEEAV